ncbi:MAG: heme oxygenase [Citrobacter freundii]|nr:MAG: heme oxygenase [Citrobacter freundii]
MNQSIARLTDSSSPTREQVVHHPVYTFIKDISSLRVFMEYHVYAVWDFMSLLKSLQIGLTCTSLPWFPVGDGETRYLINEIVTGEESDVDPSGERKSHFELYLDAMRQCGASTAGIEAFIASLQKQGDLQTAFREAGTPAQAAAFVTSTFDVIRLNKPWIQAAVFTFGREDLIPSMFLAILEDIRTDEPEKLSRFRYYLERHIEVDGDHHSQLALKMTANLCGEDSLKWNEAEAAVKTALEKRVALWNGALEDIKALASKF